jgi:hypothetical protein
MSRKFARAVTSMLCVLAQRAETPGRSVRMLSERASGGTSSMIHEEFETAAQNALSVGLPNGIVLR